LALASKLSVELAAARSASTTADALAARVDNRFQLVTNGSHAAPTRRQTLGATIDWSYPRYQRSSGRSSRRM
jgi:predicted ATPase